MNRISDFKPEEQFTPERDRIWATQRRGPLQLAEAPDVHDGEPRVARSEERLAQSRDARRHPPGFRGGRLLKKPAAEPKADATKSAALSWWTLTDERVREATRLPPRGQRRRRSTRGAGASTKRKPIAIIVRPLDHEPLPTSASDLVTMT